MKTKTYIVPGDKDGVCENSCLLFPIKIRSNHKAMNLSFLVTIDNERRDNKDPLLAETLYWGSDFPKSWHGGETCLRHQLEVWQTRRLKKITLVESRLRTPDRKQDKSWKTKDSDEEKDWKRLVTKLCLMPSSWQPQLKELSHGSKSKLLGEKVFIYGVHRNTPKRRSDLEASIQF